MSNPIGNIASSTASQVGGLADKADNAAQYILELATSVSDRSASMGGKLNAPLKDAANIDKMAQQVLGNRGNIVDYTA